MALGLKQQLKLSQQLVMTPQLQQAIKLLQLNQIELESLVQQELQENPVLEDAPESEDDAPGSAGEAAASPSEGPLEGDARALEAPEPGEVAPATSGEPSDAEKLADLDWQKIGRAHV